MVSFSVTWDYRCPFARNADEQVVAGLEAGADWQVGFVPLSLGQLHVAEGEPDIWDRPGDDSGLFALQVGTVVRDEHPERFGAVHRAMFALRHDEGRKLTDEEAVAEVLRNNGVEPGPVLERVGAGAVLDQVRSEHEAAVSDHGAWGVPTFIAGGRAVFVRLMDRVTSPYQARASIERVVDMVENWSELNEFKATRLPR